MSLPSFDSASLGVPDDRKVHLYSVNSSTKIKQRVTSCIRLLNAPDASVSAASEALETEPGAPSTTAEDNPDPRSTADTALVLYAKAGNANKLISIVEIAKRELEKILRTSDANGDGRSVTRSDAVLFQYSLLKGVHEDQQALAEARAQSQLARENKRKRSQIPSQDSGVDVPAKKRVDTGATTDGAAEHDNEDGESDYFETMDSRKRAVKLIEQELEGKPPRETPVMIVVLTRKAIKALREQHG